MAVAQNSHNAVCQSACRFWYKRAVCHIYIYIYHVHACEHVCLEIIQQILYSGGSGFLGHYAMPVGRELSTLQSGLLHPSAGVKQSTDPEDWAASSFEISIIISQHGVISHKTCAFFKMTVKNYNITNYLYLLITKK